MLGAVTGVVVLSPTAMVAGGGARLLDAAPAPTKILVYKSPTCGCCTAWLDHLEASGFAVTARDVPDVAPIKQRYGIPERLASCHTGLVAGYAVEGHVPAADIKRLIKEKPKAVGLAVPGMPMGSPGMEGPRKDRYDVILVGQNGKTRVYASH
ncbi:MAG: DUF411 domain-containing protein [Gemmatimonadetes bacterium]|nr:DUF411 domain-containing protein [Gemmatimonadota bacterium]